MGPSEPSVPTTRICQERLHQLYGVVQQEQRRRTRQWEDEAPMLEAQIQALTGTKEIIIREQKQITAQLTNLKTFLNSQAAAAAAAAASETQPDASLTGSDVTISDLQQQLSDLQSKVLDQEQALSQLQEKLADPDACRPDERSIYETQLVILQDTKRLLQAEVVAITSEIKRREASARLETDRQSAAQVGLSDLGRLNEQLASTEARLDAAKLETYFPKIKGFRFSGGGGGVYCGAKDLHLCEVSGAFSVALEVVPQQHQEQQQQQQQEAKLKITLSGLSGSSQSHNYKQQQQAEAAPPEYKPQQQKQKQRTPPISTPASQQATPLQSPKQPQQEQPGDISILSSTDVQPAVLQQQQNMASTAVQLVDSAAATDTNVDAVDGAQITSSNSSSNGNRPAMTHPVVEAVEQCSVGTAVTSTAGTASGFDLAGTSSDIAHSGTLGDSALTRHVGTSSDNSLLGPTVPNKQPDAVVASNTAGVPVEGGPAAAAAAAALSPVFSTDVGAGVEAPQQQQQQQYVTSPPGLARSSSDAAGVSPIHRQNSASSSCSSSMSSEMGRSPGPNGQFKSKLASRMDGMKGKFGGFMAESKFKLQESRQKLQSSKFMTESRQMLQESRQKLQDSKLLAESRAAAKHLLDDSRTFVARSEAEIKQKLSDLQQQKQRPHQQPQEVFSQGSTRRVSEQQQQQQSPRHPALRPMSPALSAQNQRQQQQQQQQQQQRCGESLQVGLGPVLVDHQPEQQQQQQAPGPPSSAGTASAAARRPSTAPTSPPHTAQQQRPHSSSNSSSGYASPPSSTATTAGVDGAAAGTTRKGVVVMLLAEGLEVVGEKGTKVPNIRAAQLSLEVEVCMNATFTYTPLMGWQSAGLSFEVVSLEREVQGANIPLPRTLIKSVLNMIMPSVFTKLLLTSLPHELGAFISESAAASTISSSNSCSSSSGSSSSGVWLSGEISLSGPPAACLSANLTLTSDDVPRGKADIREFAKDLRAAQQARSLLHLQDPRHAKVLAMLFNAGPHCLLPGGFTGTASGSSSGSSNSGSGLSLRDLSRFYLKYSGSSVWNEICNTFQTAAESLCQQQPQHQSQSDQTLSQANCSSSSSHDGAEYVGKSTEESNTTSSSQDQTDNADGINNTSSSSDASVFSFSNLMTHHVRGLVRKPVRVRCGVHQLLLRADVAAALAAVRDYWDRSTREWAENAKGEDAVKLLHTPLPQRLEQINSWYTAAAAAVASLAKQFQCAGGQVLVTADSQNFSCAVRHAKYEGPLKLQVPIPVLTNVSSGSCSWDISLSDPSSSNGSIASKIRFVSNALLKAAFGTTEDEQEQQKAAAAAMHASTRDVPMTLAAELESLVQCWQQQHQWPACGSTTFSSRSNDRILGFTCSGSSQPSNSTSSVSTALHNGHSYAAFPSAAAAAVACYDTNTPACLLTSSSGSSTLGRVVLSELSLGLVLDQKRLHDLLVTGITDPHLVTDLLGSFGPVFTASVTPSWPCGSGLTNPHHVDVLGPQHQTGLIQLANNEVTRFRAELDCASFTSAVTPGVAVKLAHITVLATAMKILGSGSKQLDKINQVFGHVFEYVSKDCLDLLLSINASAAASTEGSIQVELQGTPPTTTAGMHTSSSQQHGSAAANGPFHIVNDVDLLTILDTVTLLTQPS